MNLNLTSVGRTLSKLTDTTEPRQGATSQTEPRPCEAEARPSQLKKLPRGRLEPRQMPRGLHPWLQLMQYCTLQPSSTERRDHRDSSQLLPDIAVRLFYFANIYLCAFSQINKRFTAPNGSWTDYLFIATKLNGHRSENKLNFTRNGITLFMYYFVHNC